MSLSASEIRRYSRHLTLPEVGMEGQAKLQAASVVLIGAGGLGSPIALYLAAAGVGRIGLVEFDRVDESNLQRQVLYSSDDVGRPKLDAAIERIQGVNPHVQLDRHDVRLDAANAQAVLADFDLVVDGTDNFPTRYLVNDACVLLGKPNVYGSIFRFEGQVSIFAADGGPCYRCLYPEPPDPGSVPNCAEGGVLGVLPGIIGSIQATEAIKWILGIGRNLVGRLLLFDALEMRFRELKLRKDPDCPVCGTHPSIRTLQDTENSCARPDDAVAAGHRGDFELTELSVTALKQRIDAGDAPVILDVRTEQERGINRLEDDHWIPMQEINERMSELDPTRETVVYCHIGGRSAMVARFLAANGFRKVSNLTGGIDAWAVFVDSSIPRY